jgi:hypothetical protein
MGQDENGLALIQGVKVVAALAGGDTMRAGREYYEGIKAQVRRDSQHVLRGADASGAKSLFSFV